MITTKKIEIPAASAETGRPCINAMPLTGRLAGRMERLSQFLLRHRCICHVLDDTSFEKSFRSHVAIDYNTVSKFEMGPNEPVNKLLFNCSMTITNMSVFLRMLPAKAEHANDKKVPEAPSLTKDIIILDSPVHLEAAAFDKLEGGLVVFRNMHPHAAIVAGKPADADALLQMEVLRAEGLVDNLAAKTYKTSTQLLFRGALILRHKVEKLAEAVKEGTAACDPADIHETVKEGAAACDPAGVHKIVTVLTENIQKN